MVWLRDHTVRLSGISSEPIQNLSILVKPDIGKCAHHYDTLLLLEEMQAVQHPPDNPPHHLSIVNEQESIVLCVLRAAYEAGGAYKGPSNAAACVRRGAPLPRIPLDTPCIAYSAAPLPAETTEHVDAP
jgi:hypothetical protein